MTVWRELNEIMQNTNGNKDRSDDNHDDDNTVTLASTPAVSAIAPGHRAMGSCRPRTPIQGRGGRCHYLGCK